MNVFKILFTMVSILYVSNLWAACTNENYGCVCNTNYYVVGQGTSSCYCALCPIQAAEQVFRATAAQ